MNADARYRIVPNSETAKHDLFQRDLDSVTKAEWRFVGGFNSQHEAIEHMRKLTKESN